MGGTNFLWYLDEVKNRRFYYETHSKQNIVRGRGYEEKNKSRNKSIRKHILFNRTGLNNVRINNDHDGLRRQ